MPSLFFTPITDKNKYRFGFGEDAIWVGSTCISISVTLLDSTYVELETGENFRSLIGELQIFKESDFSEGSKREFIGNLTYYEAGEDSDSGKSWLARYAVQAYLPDTDFNMLVSIMTKGVDIKHIGIATPLHNEYFEFGAAPDGSVIEWQNIKRRYVEFKGFSISLE